jgi:hypothetical protein
MMGLSLGKSDLREKASDVDTIRRAWKNWDKMFENDNEQTHSSPGPLSSNVNNAPVVRRDDFEVKSSIKTENSPKKTKSIHFKDDIVDEKADIEESSRDDLV